MSDEYQGWTNRETWAAHNWIINNEWICEAIKELLPAALEEQMEQIQEYGYIPPAPFFADLIKDQFNSWAYEVFEAAQSTEQVTPEQCTMIDDIGSFDRVNWLEIAKALLASYEETEEQQG